MKLTPQEQVVCNVFSRDDGSGKVQCDRCPLALDIEHCLCKSNVTESEYKVLSTLQMKERIVDDKNGTFSCH